MDGWLVEHFLGDAGEFHRREPAPGHRHAWFFDVDRPTYVMGSAQPVESVDDAAAHASGISVVRRRSGGGGVLLMPGGFVWLDVVVPAGDPLWVDDVGRSMRWLGELWAAALAPWMADLHVHHGRFEPSPWSTLMCFAGRGPGELFGPGGAKVVGISQRRTRQWARLQSMCHLAWRPDVYGALAAASPRSVAAPMVRTVPAAVDEVVAALRGALSSTSSIVTAP
jgi:lipoate---protein ligase